VIPKPGCERWNESRIRHAGCVGCWSTTVRTARDRDGAGIDRQALGAELTRLSATHGATWRGELTVDIPAFLGAVEALLTGLGLLRVEGGDEPAGDEAETWWFSPATGRWDIPPATRTPRRRDEPAPPSAPNSGDGGA
jgi:hypothetical protein